MMQSVSYPHTAESERRRLHNFSAGPGALPTEVMEEVRDELPVYDGMGASIMEVSHRSKEFDAIWVRAQERMRRLLGMGDDWHVLFLQGGASMQFYQVPLNFLREGASADYLNTGAWSKKAIKEAKRCGNVNVAASSEELEERFVKEARGEGLLGLKGHRSVGGIRASTYNAVEPASVQALVEFMRAFEGRNG